MLNGLTRAHYEGWNTLTKAVEQACCCATYGYCYKVVIPLSIVYQNEFYIYPPLQPWFPYSNEQSINCWAEKLYCTPLTKLTNPYKAPVAAKAQAPVQTPWYLTGVTALGDQSSSYGN